MVEPAAGQAAADLVRPVPDLVELALDDAA
jgi:hypothetical protein